jgi:hypothetical protein
MYADLDNTVFVSTHVKGHGTLGNLYYNKTSTLPMGDIPSVLYMFSPLVGGVGNWNDYCRRLHRRSGVYQYMA